MFPWHVALLASLSLACDSAHPTTVSSSLGAAGQAVFTEDFESGNLAAWHDGVDPVRHTIVRDPASAQSGSHYLAVKYPRGGDGGWLTHFLPSRFDSLTVSFHARFPPDWEGGTKLVGLYGSPAAGRWAPFGKAGVCPSGTDYFAAMIVTEPSGSPGPVRFYTYYPAMAREPDGTTCWGRYGDGSETYFAPPPLERGRWHHVEFAVTLNAPGRKDARQTFRLNGGPQAAWEGFSFGDTAVLKLSAVQLSFSVTGGVPRDLELHVDNLEVRRFAKSER